MIRRFAFEQTLDGSYELAGDAAGGHPLTLRLRASKPRLLPPLSGPLEVRGEIIALGLASRRPVRGRVTLERLGLGGGAYDLELEDDAGRPLRLRARRASLTRVTGEILTPGGLTVARIELRLDYRSALGRLLGG